MATLLLSALDGKVDMQLLRDYPLPPFRIIGEVFQQLIEVCSIALLFMSEQCSPIIAA